MAWASGLSLVRLEGMGTPDNIDRCRPRWRRRSDALGRALGIDMVQCGERRCGQARLIRYNPVVRGTGRNPFYSTRFDHG
jgi:hypothetical protein